MKSGFYVDSTRTSWSGLRAKLVTLNFSTVVGETNDVLNSDAIYFRLEGYYMNTEADVKTRIGLLSGISDQARVWLTLSQGPWNSRNLANPRTYADST